MNAFETPLEIRAAAPARSEVEQRELHLRADALLGKLHSLTRSRDAGAVTSRDSLPRELALVVELGQVQDRLRLLGGHDYGGCSACRPRPTPRN